MRFLIALVNLYISLWKAWSVPPPKQKPMGTALVVYDQERENDTYHDHDWEWPDVPENAEIHDLDERFQRIIDKMRDLPGIDSESVRMAYMGFDLTYAHRGDVQAEYTKWLTETNEGRFQQYLIDTGGYRADA